MRRGSCSVTVIRCGDVITGGALQKADVALMQSAASLNSWLLAFYLHPETDFTAEIWTWSDKTSSGVLMLLTCTEFLLSGIGSHQYSGRSALLNQQGTEYISLYRYYSGECSANAKNQKCYDTGISENWFNCIPRPLRSCWTSMEQEWEYCSSQNPGREGNQQCCFYLYCLAFCLKFPA